MVVGASSAYTNEKMLASASVSRAKITPGVVQSPVASTAEPDGHKSKVCSVLLPIYAASVEQKADTFMGYDKVTTSPVHKASLPRWNVSEEKKNKYRNSECRTVPPPCHPAAAVARCRNRRTASPAWLPLTPSRAALPVPALPAATRRPPFHSSSFLTRALTRADRFLVRISTDLRSVRLSQGSGG